MKYDINRPWLTLDDWQKDYIYNTHPEENSFLLCGRQVGKTTAISIKCVELCMKNFKKGELILINSITEKQGYHVLAKCLAYAQEKYKGQIKKGKDRPTMHKILFKNGTGILSYAAGETGEGLRGYTIKKLIVDEGSRMSEEYFIAVMPMISITKGSIDIASTPFGKRHKDGTDKFFYKCSKDDKFKKFYVSAEDCPRHDKDFLDQQKEKMSKLAYAQEYLAIFTDELLRIFDDDLINDICILKRENFKSRKSRYYIGCDIAAFGKDECTYEVFEVRESGEIRHRENIVERRNYTTDTSKKIIQLNRAYDFIKVGIDDAGVGFGVYSELMNDEETKRKTEALNNASRPLNRDGTRSKKILKEEMYLNLLALMENKNIGLLDDDEVKASLASMQYDEDGKIFGWNSHVTEGIIRGAWLAEKDKGLKVFIRTF